MFLSPYQPTDPGLFHEMIASLPIELSKFTFIDIGSGKGRTLLMASSYPFRRIVGIEVLPELNGIAEGNIQVYKSSQQRCFDIVTLCADAREYQFPEEPTVVYLFNPLPEAGLRQLVASLESWLSGHAHEVWIVYHNTRSGSCTTTLYSNLS